MFAVFGQKTHIFICPEQEVCAVDFAGPFRLHQINHNNTRQTSEIISSTCSGTSTVVNFKPFGTHQTLSIATYKIPASCANTEDISTFRIGQSPNTFSYKPMNIEILYNYYRLVSVCTSPVCRCIIVSEGLPYVDIGNLGVRPITIRNSTSRWIVSGTCINLLSLLIAPIILN